LGVAALEVGVGVETVDGVVAGLLTAGTVVAGCAARELTRASVATKLRHRPGVEGGYFMG
jgi:hypothetical protein